MTSDYITQAHRRFAVFKSIDFNNQKENKYGA